MAGRILAGLGQLTLALAGFTMFIIWFCKERWSSIMARITGDVPLRPVGWIGVVGLIVFAAAWLWSLMTSISLVREAKRNEIAEVMKHWWQNRQS